MKIDLTDHEEQIVRHLAQPQSWWDTFGYYVAFLAPMIGFIVYGAYFAEMVAVACGVVGLLAGIAWRLYQEWTYSGIYESIFKKVLAASEAERNA